MKVRISAHGRFHAFSLAEGLNKLGVLEALQTTYPAAYVKRQLRSNIPVRSVWPLELLKRSVAFVGGGQALDPTISRLFARALARDVHHSNADILVGWSSSTLEAIEIAHSKGMRVIIERGSTHISHQTAVIENEYRTLGIDRKVTSEEIIEREIAEYEAADAICVLSNVAAKSFIEQGISREKLIVNHLGVDVRRFGEMPRRADRTRKVRFLFTGIVGVRKGVNCLLQVMKKLSGNVELQLAGNLSQEFKEISSSFNSENVTFLGPVPRTKMTQLYRDADIFVLPSIEEGFGMAVTEAMAAGLPVVVSDAVGAADILTSMKDGIIFPVNNVEALTDSLQSLIDQPALRLSMGHAAFTTATSLGDWDDFALRMRNAYQGLLASNAG